MKFALCLALGICLFASVFAPAHAEEDDGSADVEKHDCFKPHRFSKAWQCRTVYKDGIVCVSILDTDGESVALNCSFSEPGAAPKSRQLKND